MMDDPLAGRGGDNEAEARNALLEWCFTGASPMNAAYVPTYMFIQAISQALSRLEPAAKRELFDWLHGDEFRDYVCQDEDQVEIFWRVLAVLDGLVEDRRSGQRPRE